MMRARAARSAADRKPVEPHRKARFQYFGIGQPAVGHVGLHRVGPVMVGPRARAAGDRLIILVGRIAEGEIVHRPLRRRQAAGGGEQGVGHHLAGLDIACHHRRGKGRAEHRLFWHHESDRAKAAVVHRDDVVDQCAHHIERRGADDRAWGVEIVA